MGRYTANQTDIGYFDKPTQKPTSVFDKQKLPKSRRKKTDRPNVGYFSISLIHSGDVVQCIETCVAMIKIECSHALFHCIMQISQNEQFRILQFSHITQWKTSKKKWCKHILLSKNLEHGSLIFRTVRKFMKMDETAITSLRSFLTKNRMTTIRWRKLL